MDTFLSVLLLSNLFRMKVESEPSTRGFNQLNNEAGDIYNEENQLLEELESMIVEARVTDRPTLLLLTVINRKK